MAKALGNPQHQQARTIIRALTIKHYIPMKYILYLFIALCFVSATNAQESTFEPNQQLSLRLNGVPGEEVQLVSALYTVSSNYTLNLPHISEVSIRNLTRSQIEKKIEGAYRSAKIYTNPTISITADASVGQSRIVTVTGEVNRAGPVPFRPGMTLLEAIGAAGNKTDFGSLKKIKLLRGGRATQHDLSKISSNPKADVTLKSNDKIIVPKGGFTIN